METGDDFINKSLKIKQDMSFANMSRDLPYRGFAFEGGGVAGIAHIGVIKHLEKIGVYYNITHWAGSSAGAFMAGLTSCRMPPSKVEEVMLSLNFHDFEDSSWLTIRDLYHFLTTYGWNWGEIYWS